jgi:hypothetical protein
VNRAFAGDIQRPFSRLLIFNVLFANLECSSKAGDKIMATEKFQPMGNSEGFSNDNCSSVV